MTTRVIFMGSPDFAIPSLKAVAKNNKVVGVVTQPDRPAGRGRQLKSPPIKKLAQELNLPIFQPLRVHNSKTIYQITAWKPDLIVVAAFGQILKKNVLEIPKFGCINVHASLLPRWRGAAPINAAIYHGDTETGITIMKMDEGLDTGPIISQQTIQIDPSDNAGKLSNKLAEIGGRLIVETLPRYLSGDITPLPQDDSKATYAPMLKKEDGLLDFTKSSEQLVRKVKAFSPWPGTFLDWDDKIIKVHTAHAYYQASGQPGQTTRQGNLPGIFTIDGVIILDEVQPAGKNKMPGKVFLNGAKAWGVGSK
jgi:methionyl-tRNA formyltransferase